MPALRDCLTDPKPINDADIRHYRLGRVRAILTALDLPAVLIADPVNLRYATGTRNMQVWTMHNFCRYALVPASGPVTLFELPTGYHLSEGLDTVDAIRPAFALDFMSVGPRVEEMARRWAEDLAAVFKETVGGDDKRLAVDRAELKGIAALESVGLTPMDGRAVMEQARAVKSVEEVRAFKRSLGTVEDAIAEMRAQLRPGMREQEALGLLIGGSIARGGEYPETRLMTSGPRTNPWFQETNDRVMAEGDMLSFDTDIIGPGGFYDDISRSWTVGETKPSDDQRRLYDLARRQLDHNMALLRPGLGFLEYSDMAFQLPEPYIANRYADVAHGCGLGVEYPFIWYREDAEWGAYDGVFEENMIVCIEAYVGAKDGHEGVKLEQPVWVTSDGPILLSDYPLEDDYA